MTKPKLTNQEQRALLELQCELARLKIKKSRQNKLKSESPHSPPNVLQIAQIAHDTMIHNPLWKMNMMYGRGKKRWALGLALLIWQIFTRHQPK